MELIHYLEHAYFTEKQLLEAGGISAASLAELMARRLMPQPSYTLRVDLACESYFGTHTEQATVRYYAKGYVQWIGTVRGLMQEEDGFRVFSQRYLARLEVLGGGAHRPDLQEEWRHFLSGTYGLCTRSGLPEDIAAKELAVATIHQLTAGGVDALSSCERQQLSSAIDLLDLASSPFAPHERTRSSRHRLIDQLRGELQGSSAPGRSRSTMAR